jgi:23S rRNA pseudouridine1911/1915/1917 synthase
MTGIDIIFRGPSLCVVRKPAGVPVQPGHDGGDALNRQLERHLRAARDPGEVGVVHRLDTVVSGLVAFGLDPRATAHLNDQLRDRTMARTYLLLVRTAVAPKPCTVDEPLHKGKDGTVRVHPTGLPARTRFVPLLFDAAARLALLRAHLDTGRTHQIRVHAAYAIGAVAGDLRYGDLPPPRARIALHAAALELTDPATGERRLFTDSPGADFWELASGSALALPADWDQSRGVSDQRAM